ncbi:hypothetical protein N7532_005953 [Penicillium argentinense]|uniref:NAD dependent epimerase/dehydratase n=1 Tax=Penicillium argentinense TaxID=1131581 RepID=A0A9W9FEZ0_9EURO|nr:uncharacterized protein N7532_005953 [Penicillium argentinense]KAJ5098952.1 hypothetical protein N7532_005953 [Penicillium argentinense]
MFASESPSSYDIDREKCYRAVPMRVLVLGLSRTGTESEPIYIALRKALVHLGYNGTYHGYAAAVEYPRDCELWLRAMRAKYDGTGAPFVREDWDLLLGDYQLGVKAVCDVPAACFAEELMDAYPNARVILTNRDTDAWFESVQKTLIANAFTRRASFISFLATITRSPNRWTRPVMMYALSDFFGGSFERNGRQVYQEHYDRVRKMAAERKMELLEYEVTDGWGPLCKFLGHDMPENPFPRGNDKQEVNTRIKEMINREVRRLLLIFAVLLSCLLLIILIVLLLVGL